MAQYLVLIYEDETAWANATEEDHAQALKDHTAFADEAGARFIGGNALQPTHRDLGPRDPRRSRHRRPVHGDQGGPGRLLRARGRRPGPGDRARQAVPASRGGVEVRTDPGPFEADRTREPVRGRGREAVADAHRREWASVLAATVRVTRDLDPAEECVQDALRAGADRVGAATACPRARRVADDRRAAQRALDLLRRERHSAQAAAARRARRRGPAERGRRIRDDRLRLVFTCCHPALAVRRRSR